MPGALILINGFPGVGKHSVAHELAHLLPNCRVFDTRNLVFAASQLYPSGDPAHGVLRKNLKHAIFDSIAQNQANTPVAQSTPGGSTPPTFILTDFLSVAARPTDRDIMHEFISFAQRSGFAFIHVILSCDTDENVRRFTSPGRVEAMRLPGRESISADPAHIIQIRMEEELGHIAPIKGLSGEYELDTTKLDPRTTAAVLAEYCLDTLRRVGWWINLRAARPAATASRSTVPRTIPTAAPASPPANSAAPLPDAATPATPTTTTSADSTPDSGSPITPSAPTATPLPTVPSQLKPTMSVAAASAAAANPADFRSATPPVRSSGMGLLPSLGFGKKKAKA